MGVAWFAAPFALVLGLLAVTTEIRHGTITPTLLATPSRGRVVAAKLVAHLLAGLAIGVAAFVVDVVLVGGSSPRAASRAAPRSARRCAGGAGIAASAALLAGLGVGVGALVRNQVGALVGGFAWLFVLEPLLTAIPTVGEQIERFGVGGLLDALDGVDAGSGGDLLAQVPAGLVLAGYAVLAALGGAALLRRRDVTA